MLKIQTKTIIIFSLFMLFAFLAMAKSAEAANHYIRAGAAGGNNGSDWTNAWTSLPSSLTRGDIYYIADGSYGSHAFNDAVSGIALITIKKATALDHGTGTGWQTSYGDGQAVFSPSLTFCKGYYVFDGVTGGGPMSWDSGHGFKIYAATQAENGMLLLSDKYGVCGRKANSDLTISHVEFAANNDWSQPITAAVGYDISNITLEYLYFNGCNRGRILNGFSYAPNWIIQKSYFKGGAVDVDHHFINIRIDNGHDWHIRYNLFEDWVSTGSIGNYAVANNIKIYGNVFVNTFGHEPDSAPAIFTNSGATATTNWTIHNNSFVNLHTPQIIDLTDGAAISGNTAYNNIFHLTNGTPTRSGTKADYNWYYPPLTHGETYSANGAGDPFVSWTMGNYRLSAAIAAGTSLSSPYNIDPDGVTRGADGVWDRGAYEYASGDSDTVPPAAPKGLLVQ